MSFIFYLLIDLVINTRTLCAVFHVKCYVLDGITVLKVWWELTNELFTLLYKSWAYLLSGSMSFLYSTFCWYCLWCIYFGWRMYLCCVGEKGWGFVAAVRVHDLTAVTRALWATAADPGADPSIKTQVPCFRMFLEAGHLQYFLIM